ncbi:hypothetical protein [Rhodococcoides fascians]|uniref:hypothetical protein n=1 Tax=Rhodococcoides fascians TaxID=1828 RepID=UPI00050C7F6F|nr:hypothetical protein [Rhodococcus fascians]
MSSHFQTIEITGDVHTITATHPNGGVSEVTVAMNDDGTLEVSVDVSQSNRCVVDVDEIMVAEVEANR